jgi:hypothetical protein
MKLATPPALSKPIALPKAETRSAASEDPPTRPEVLDHAFQLVFTLFRNLSTPIADLTFYR